MTKKNTFQRTRRNVEVIFWISMFLVGNFHLANANPQITSIGIVGDSASTGAVANSRFILSTRHLMSAAESTIGSMFIQSRSSYTRPQLSDYANAAEFGIISPISPLTRIWPSVGEPRFDRWGKISQMQMLDTPEYSWGYLLGRRLGVQPRQIFMAARHAAETRSLEYQLLSLQHPGRGGANSAFHGHQPEIVFVMMNLFDICGIRGNRILDESVQQNFLRQYEDNFRGSFQRGLQNMIPHPNGTRIVVMAPVDLLQLTRKSELLDKVIPLNEGTTTCRAIRTSVPNGRTLSNQSHDIYVNTWELIFGWKPTHLAGLIPLEPKMDFVREMCPQVMAATYTDHARIGAIGSIGRRAFEMQRQITAELSRQAPRGISIHHIMDTGLIDLSPEDYANDCWHPSLRGHEKVARTIYNALFRDGLLSNRE